MPLLAKRLARDTEQSESALETEEIAAKAKMRAKQEQSGTQIIGSFCRKQRWFSFGAQENTNRALDSPIRRRLHIIGFFVSGGVSLRGAYFLKTDPECFLCML